jgi:serine/threonine-protein kinase
MSTHESGPSADGNLLFGILALQMDFISRDALVQAMNAWVLDKAKPLGRILLEQQALNADEHDLLQALVQKHIDKHGGDAQKSLASLSSLGSARQHLHQIADGELHQSLAHVAANRADEDDLFATRPPSVGALTSAGLRFRRLRPYAKGGLGEVFVALDAELHREVALKEIQDRHADNPDSRARFLLEAEITGGLEHPGIVPVYGLGSYADGRPYYAMRFIPGDSLQEAIARFHKADTPRREVGERALALRQLLGRFVDVCDAIAYAHSRGVLHRDLKPGNVMLGAYGETLVVDWGLAKAMGSQTTEENGTVLERPLQPQSHISGTPTQMGAAVGTPAYMPPEQAAGRLDLLGPASDVYGLGAMLYSLLTGKAPVMGGELGEVLRKVQAGDFPRPRQVKRDVPAALEAVCLKAMALKPEERYPTPRALAADVERWLADEAVGAWREPLSMRIRRWVGHHRTLVSTTATVLLMATVSLMAATVLLQEANKRERQAKDDKEAALRQAEDNAQEAKHQKETAEEQKRETEKQAAIALAVNEFLQKDLLGQADIGKQMVGAREVRDPDVKVRTLLDRASKSIEGKFKDRKRSRKSSAPIMPVPWPPRTTWRYCTKSRVITIVPSRSLKKCCKR